MEVIETTIDPKDLRIGNWVTNGEKNYTVDVNMLYDLVTLDYYPIFPIAIKKEILESCGFNETVEEYNASENGITCKKIDGVKNIGLAKYKIFPIRNEWVLVNLSLQCEVGAAFKYLHQLQNLYFALTMEELEVDLNSLQTTSKAN